MKRKLPSGPAQCKCLESKAKMTVSEFRAPGLNDAQLEQIGALATSLDSTPLMWVSGFPAGLNKLAREVAIFDALDLTLGHSRANAASTNISATSSFARAM